MSFWAVLDFALLVGGALLVAFSQIFKSPNLMINFALNDGWLMSAYNP